MGQCTHDSRSALYNIYIYTVRVDMYISCVSRKGKYNSLVRQYCNVDINEKQLFFYIYITVQYVSHVDEVDGRTHCQSVCHVARVEGRKNQKCQSVCHVARVEGRTNVSLSFM